MGKTRKEKTFNRRSALRTERDRYSGDWKECSDYILGARGRFLPGDADTSDEARHRRNERLYNETPKQACHTLASGMMAGITSPARPWFKLRTPDPNGGEDEATKMWLNDVEKILLAVFASSNFYGSMWNCYLELGAFGTTCIGEYEDFENVVRFEPYTIGSFSLGADGRRNVDTMYREFRLSVGEMVKRFGLENCSMSIQNLYNTGDMESRFNIIHAVEPNDGRDLSSKLSKDMAYRSVYYEENCDGDKPLKESGFNEKPFMAPRWSAIGDDVYSTSYPGIDSLSSNKSLQIEELDKAVAIEKMHNPPLVGDAALKQSGADLIAGGITYTPNMTASGKPGLAPVYEVAPRISELNESIMQKEHRIQRFFYADLFMMITEMDRAQITATEIAERKEEKMLMLGPVLERLNNELLDPIIDRTFAICQRAGILPPPPPDLEGVDLEVEYISVLAQAQKAISTASVESTVAFAGELAAVWPEARHKIDPMQAIDEYSKAKGAPPKIIRSDDDANEAAQAEADAANQQQQAAMAAQGVDSAKTASETEVGDESMLDKMLSAGAGMGGA